MKLPKVITDAAAKAVTTVAKYSPEILVGVGVVSIVATAVLAVKATPKAMADIDEARREKKANLNEDAPAEAAQLTTPEIIKVSWKHYVPAVITGTCGIASVIGVRNIEARKISALGLACQAANIALDDKTKYVEKLEKTLGAKKTDAVQAEMVTERVANTCTNEIVEKAKNNPDKVMFLDMNTGQYFLSTRNKVDTVFNRFNANLRNDMFLTGNDLLFELGEVPTTANDILGYTMDEYPVEPTYISTWLDEENGITCTGLRYSPAITQV